jgi:hypothetical protein
MGLGGKTYFCIYSEMREMKQKRKEVDCRWVSNFSIPIHSILEVHSPTFSHVEMVHSPLLSDKAVLDNDILSMELLDSLP